MTLEDDRQRVFQIIYNFYYRKHVRRYYGKKRRARKSGK